jgi:hypothetical protein
MKGLIQNDLLLQIIESFITALLTSKRSWIRKGNDPIEYQWSKVAL